MTGEDNQDIPKKPESLADDDFEESGYLRAFLKRLGLNEKTAPKEQFSQILTDLRLIRNRYGIRPKLHDINEKDRQYLRAERMDFEDGVEAVRILREELAKYPPEMIRNSGITHFRILETLEVEKLESVEPLGGRAYEEGDIYIANGENENYYRKTIHHELWHRFDYQRYEHKDRISFLSWLDELRDSILDGKWIELNKKNGQGYLGSKWKTVPTGHRPTGFTRSYGTKNPHEDRATNAEIMMTNINHLKRMCERDQLLSTKTKMIAELYLRDSNGLMDKQYFDDLASGKVNEEYWDRKMTS